MKTRNLIIALLASVSLVSMQSCLKDQADIFDKSSSERIQDQLLNTMEVLAANHDGWIMEYYPGSGQSRGGYAYHLLFTESEVVATCELDPYNSYKSLYKLTDDNGAVLSFDSYNEALHYFATPSASEYQAKGGDFEFTITSVSPEKVGLRGKRSGNHYDLYPYTSNLEPSAYMAKVAEMSESMRASIIEGKIGSTDVTGEVDFNYRHITFSYADPASEEGEMIEVSTPFMYTADGLRTYEPCKVAGATLHEFYYHVDNNILTNGVYEFKGKLPEDYVNYSDFIGDWVLHTDLDGSYGPYKINLAPNDAKDGFILSGLNSHFTLNVGYNKAKGHLSLCYQIVGTSSGSNYVAFCPWDADAGYLTWLEGVGVEFSRDMDHPNELVFNVADNGEWGSYNCNSFILYEFNGAGSSIGSYTAWGEYRFPYFSSLKRN